MKIVLDVYGGDNAPQEILKGAIDAINEKDGFQLVLVGKQGEIETILSQYSYDTARVEIVNADDVITNDDVPTEAIRRKKNSSIVSQKICNFSVYFLLRLTESIFYAKIRDEY